MASDGIVVTQTPDHILGSCPVCGQKKVRVANKLTECGHRLTLKHRRGLSEGEWLAYIHGDAETQIHYGKKMKLAGFEDLE